MATSPILVMVLVALLTGAADAAPFGRSITALAVSAPPGTSSLPVGPATFGPSVIVPAVPTPRSPFQPPTWVSSTPPWLR